MFTNDLRKKIVRLTNILMEYDSLAIALSGGVDSVFLVLFAKKILGAANVLAITAKSVIHFDHDLRDAEYITKKLGIKHIFFKSKEMYLDRFIMNNKHRCYFCKQSMLKIVKQIASKNKFVNIAHGANKDDLYDYRPGFKAVDEIGILSPLVEANFSKEEVRYMVKFYGINFWNKPAMSCLATRLPYGTKIDFQSIKKIKEAELFLHSIGFKMCRVRHHKTVARIEIDLSNIESMFNKDTRNKVIKTFKKIGYQYVSLDIEGYRQGSMNFS